MLPPPALVVDWSLEWQRERPRRVRRHPVAAHHPERMVTRSGW